MFALGIDRKRLYLSLLKSAPTLEEASSSTPRRASFSRVAWKETTVNAKREVSWRVVHARMCTYIHAVAVAAAAAAATTTIAAAAAAVAVAAALLLLLLD
uniref:Uncharacterized protein n=1 Tax=Vespula pensylvanica TaxID=30213 RepID=A0A834N0P3_VESPE|nr:hypothetical protein H0235_017384 [Vespula pensylvanica]